MATNNSCNTANLVADGSLLIGSSIGGPVATTLTAGSGLSISNGANSITIGFAPGTPPTSDTATTGFGSLTTGASTQNLLGYDVLVSGSINVTAAVGGSVVIGTGPTSTPTTDPLTPALSTALLIFFSVMVPNNYYILINTSGTITIGSITNVVTPL